MSAACGGGLKRELEVVVASWCPWLSSPVATGILEPQHLSNHTGQSPPLYLQASSARYSQDETVPALGE